MAFTFPLPITQFFNLLPIADIMFDAPEQMQESQTGKGEKMSFELAPQLWVGDVKFGAMTVTESAQVSGLLDILRPAGRTFFAYDPRRRFPLTDPTGSILGASAPVIASLPNAREMTISGLPAGYVLSIGDYLAFDYGTPARRALHQLVQGVVANGAGLTPVFEVSPMVRPGAAVAAPVTLIRASCKAVLVKGSVSKGTSKSGISRDMAFRFEQTLGA